MLCVVLVCAWCSPFDVVDCRCAVRFVCCGLLFAACRALRLFVCCVLANALCRLSASLLFMLVFGELSCGCLSLVVVCLVWLFAVGVVVCCGFIVFVVGRLLRVVVCGWLLLFVYCCLLIASCCLLFVDR